MSSEPQGRGQNYLPLPTEIFLMDIFVYLSLHDITKIRRTCKSLLSITRSRSLWNRLIHIEILEKLLPIPGLRDGTLGMLSAEALEDSLRRAIRLRRNWSSPTPKPTKQVVIVPSDEPMSRSIFLEFLPGRGNRWLLSVTMHGGPPRRFTIQCWDVDASPPSCVAILEHVGSFGGIVVNLDPTNDAILALQFASTEIFTIDFSSKDPWSAFVSIIDISGSREFYFFKGSKLVTRHTGGDISVWDIHAPEYEVKLQNPTHLEPERCQAVVLRDSYVIMIRLTTCEIYALPTHPSNESVICGATTMLPVAQYRWQWRIDTVCVAERPSFSAPLHHISPSSHSPISILIRFGSIFPWPINILHHFILQPNSSYSPLTGIHTYNLPYIMEPKLVQSIGSPIRLFAMSHVALGQYGTALFIDSHTEDYFAYSDHGQRLAGELLTQVSDDEGSGQQAESSNYHTSSGMASMVFGVREHDEWFGIAMDEEAGRIALSRINGGVSLFEYG